MGRAATTAPWAVGAMVAVLARPAVLPPPAAEPPRDPEWQNVDPWYLVPENRAKVIGIANGIKSKPSAGVGYTVTTTALSALALGHAARLAGHDMPVEHAELSNEARRLMTGVLAWLNKSEDDRKAIYPDKKLDSREYQRYSLPMILLMLEHFASGLDAASSGEYADDREPIGSVGRVASPWADWTLELTLRLILHSSTEFSTPLTPLEPGMLTGYTTWNSDPDAGVMGALAMGLSSAWQLDDLGTIEHDPKVLERVNRRLGTTLTAVQLRDRWTDVLTHMVLALSAQRKPASPETHILAEYTPAGASAGGDAGPGDFEVRYRLNRDLGRECLVQPLPTTMPSGGHVKYFYGTRTNTYQCASGCYALLVASHLLDGTLRKYDRVAQVKTLGTGPHQWRRAGGTLSNGGLTRRTGRYCNFGWGGGSDQHIDRVVEAGVAQVISTAWDERGAINIKERRPYVLFTVGKLFTAAGMVDAVVNGSVRQTHWWHREFSVAVADTQADESDALPREFAILTIARGFRPLYPRRTPADVAGGPEASR